MHAKFAVTFLTIGSSILKIGLHPKATRFRSAMERVATVARIFWGDYQARIDMMNFYNLNPMAEMALPTENGAVIRLVEIGRMLDHAMYRRIRLQFLSACTASSSAETTSEHRTITSCSYADLFQPNPRRSLQTAQFR